MFVASPNSLTMKFRRNMMKQFFGIGPSMVEQGKKGQGASASSPTESVSEDDEILALTDANLEDIVLSGEKQKIGWNFSGKSDLGFDSLRCGLRPGEYTKTGEVIFWSQRLIEQETPAESMTGGRKKRRASQEARKNVELC